MRDVGESLDIARVNTNLEDLNNLAREFKYFIADKEHYSSNQPQIFTKEIDYYKNEDMWLSERLLSKEQIEKLKIEDENEINTLDDVSQCISDMVNELGKINIELNEINNNHYNYKYKSVSLNECDENGILFFEITSTLIGYKQKEYREKQVESSEGYPLYTAAKNCVAYLPKNHVKLMNVKKSRPHITIATDGDGTAGTNILLHKTPYFLNSSRISIIIHKENILPEYIYYNLKNIKKKYGFGYTIKCNKDNLEKYIQFEIPIDENGNFSVKIQKDIISKMQRREEILNKISSYEEMFKSIRKFSQFLALFEE